MILQVLPKGNKAEHALQSYAAGKNYYGAILEYAMHAEHMLSNKHMLLKY